jgi:PAS domain S-box-containing protein
MTERELRLKIVVVDDNADGRELTSTILRREGFEILQAATGAEALALATERPALMILDVNLPDIDGFEVCRQLKHDPRTSDISILHLSAAYRGTVHRIRGLEEGADAYLTMPVEPQELVATVRALLRARRAEAELRQVQEYFRRLVDGALEGVWTVDADARTTYVNPRMAAMLGYEVAEMLGRPVFDFLDEAARADAVARFARRQQGESEVFDARLRRHDGSELWTIVSALAIMDEQGRFHGALGLVTDITERRRAEAAERESQALRAVAHLASAAAHEINNPLTVITGQLHFLTRELPDSQRVTSMTEAADRIREIVMRMLHITRLHIIPGGADLPDMLDLDRSSRPDRRAS